MEATKSCSPSCVVHSRSPTVLLHCETIEFNAAAVSVQLVPLGTVKNVSSKKALHATPAPAPQMQRARLPQNKQRALQLIRNNYPRTLSIKAGITAYLCKAGRGVGKGERGIGRRCAKMKFGRVGVLGRGRCDVQVSQLDRRGAAGWRSRPTGDQRRREPFSNTNTTAKCKGRYLSDFVFLFSVFLLEIFRPRCTPLRSKPCVSSPYKKAISRAGSSSSSRPCRKRTLWLQGNRVSLSTDTVGVPETSQVRIISARFFFPPYPIRSEKLNVLKLRLIIF